MNKNLLNDLELGDLALFRNGGVATITYIEYEPTHSGDDFVTLGFDDNDHDIWTYDLDGSPIVGSESIFDIVEIRTMEELSVELFPEGMNDN